MLYGWPGVLAEDMLHHVHEFKAKLDIVVGQSGGHVVLPLPLPLKQIKKTTPNILHVLEGTCMSWWKQIEAVMVSGISNVSRGAFTSSGGRRGGGGGGGGGGRRGRYWWGRGGISGSAQPQASATAQRSDAGQ